MRLLLLSLLASIALPLSAQDAYEGIAFEKNKPFEELLAQAKSEDKLIFIDAYATWCGPCKMMDAKVFTQARVGEVYNERFINAKIDMEKGEGPRLARQYGVMAYPTYLYVDGEGEIVHKAMGYIPADQLLAAAEEASSDDNLGALNKRYDGGERGEAFMETYLTKLAEQRESQRADQVLEEYLKTQDDWTQPAITRLIVDNPGRVGSNRMHFLLTHPEEASAAAGSGLYMFNLQRTLLTQFMQDSRKRILPPAGEVLPFYTKYAAPLKSRLVMHYEMFRAEQMRDMPAHLAAAKDYFKAYPSNDYAELNTIAWTFYEHGEDPADLELASAWAKKSVELNPSYPNLDTLAWLYHKTGRHELAKETARRAIDFAKETDQDYSETARILEE